MVSQSKARQIKAKRSLAWQIFSHVRFVFVASVHDILVRISFKEIFLTGFVDHSCFDNLLEGTFSILSAKLAPQSTLLEVILETFWCPGGNVKTVFSYWF